MPDRRRSSLGGSLVSFYLASQSAQLIPPERLAAGASIGIEDAAILGHLMEQAHSVSDLDSAFAALTDTQLDRAHTLISNSRQTARYMVEGATMPPAELARLDRRLKDFLFNVDMKERISAAIRTMQKEQAKL